MERKKSEVVGNGLTVPPGGADVANKTSPCHMMNTKGKYPVIIISILLVLLSAGLLFSPFRGNTENTVTLVAVGDILLDRGVRTQLEAHGYGYPYVQVKGFLQAADIAFANLECPLTMGGTPAIKDRTLIFRGNLENAAALREAGFTILSIANNHSMDYGPAGLADTLYV